MNWYEKLGKVVAQECSLEEGSEVEHQLGTVWVTDSDGNVVAISGIVPEDNL